MLGKWNRWYDGLDEPAPYGDTISYQRGADWLAGLSIEDWGCGKGWLRSFIPEHLYWGVDGSKTPYADEVADLRTRQSETQGVFLRHVLEHNRDWAQILDNATASASERLFIALFTPLAATWTHECGFTESLHVPDISFRLDDLTDRIETAGFSWRHETMEANTQYGCETIIECDR